MALFGFAINFTNGDTDYVIVSAVSLVSAEKEVEDTLEDSGAAPVESIVHYDAESIVQEQYYGCAILSNQFGGGRDD